MAEGSIKLAVETATLNHRPGETRMATVVRQPLRIDGAELRVVRLPLLKPFTTSASTMTEKVFPAADLAFRRA